MAYYNWDNLIVDAVNHMLNTERMPEDTVEKVMAQVFIPLLGFVPNFGPHTKPKMEKAVTEAFGIPKASVVDRQEKTARRVVAAKPKTDTQPNDKLTANEKRIAELTAQLARQKAAEEIVRMPSTTDPEPSHPIQNYRALAMSLARQVVRGEIGETPAKDKLWGQWNATPKTERTDADHPLTIFAKNVKWLREIEERENPAPAPRTKLPTAQEKTQSNLEKIEQMMAQLQAMRDEQAKAFANGECLNSGTEIPAAI